ncbi:MAG TPA: ribonuclease H-like domain-containing protein [Candidatus Sulfotelmatobacter sp.]|nr:ribonuclease H-like domain-containing protein [Candidatus Sulfotelmatobacter sp.]
MESWLGTVEAAKAGAELPHSKGGNIDRFSRLAALKPARGVVPRPAELRTPDETDSLSRLLGAGIARNHYGEHLAIRNWFSTPEFAEPSPASLELLTKRPASEGGRYKRQIQDSRAALEDPEKWLFLDTETTGLAGGTGTYAFLVGLAWWDAGGLQVEQLFLRDFSEEHSLLHELAARLAERPVLVTFNGKSFDWPLLENRFTMTRAIKVPQLAAHLDLLHPARALWKLRLGSVRLVELERHVLEAERLGWHRGDDVASALIPQFYFDYLRGGTADPLAGVVKHNQMDLRGLAALFGKINSLLDERQSLAAEDSLDLFGLSKFLQRRGENERAHSTCVQALDAGLPAEIRPRATRELALMAKRRGDGDSAAALWRELAGDPSDGFEACEQLAIHYERKTKDIEQALAFAQLALAKLHRQRTPSLDPYARERTRRLEEKLMCRVERLRHRIKRSDAATRAPLLAKPAAASGGVR